MLLQLPGVLLVQLVALLLLILQLLTPLLLIKRFRLQGLKWRREEPSLTELGRLKEQTGTSQVSGCDLEEDVDGLVVTLVGHCHPPPGAISA